VNSAEATDLPADYRRRPLSLDDVDAVAGVWRRCDAALGVHPESPGSALSWFADVDPAHQGRGVGSSIMRWALGVAEQRMRAEGEFEVQTMASAPNTAARLLFEGAGFRHIRSMWDMHRDIRGYDETLGPLDGVTIRNFEIGRDERTFWWVSEQAFAEHFNHTPVPYESWHARWYATDDRHPERILLAEHDGAVVGEAAWVDSDPDGYIVSVGVLPEHRGRGIARSLLRRAFAEIAASGFPNATLSVDTENTTGA